MPKVEDVIRHMQYSYTESKTHTPHLNTPAQDRRVLASAVGLGTHKTNHDESEMRYDMGDCWKIYHSLMKYVRLHFALFLGYKLR